MMKKILVTGATGGLGFATAEHLLALGHVVLLHGRSEQSLVTAAQALSQYREQLEIYAADLSDLAQVNNFIEKIKEKHTQLDAIINNAGVLKTNTPISSSGVDSRFVVNTITPYLITRKLLPLLDGGRVINLSSAAQSPVDIRGLLGALQYSDAMTAYAQSKLAITAWTLYMAEEINQTQFIPVNPGSLLATSMVKSGFGIEGKDIRKSVKLLADLAVSKDFEGESGRYFDNDIGTFVAPHPDAQNTIFQAELIKNLARFH